MLGLVQRFFRWLMLDSLDPQRVKRELEGMAREIARLQQEVGSHRGRLRGLENDVLTAKNVAGRLMAAENSASSANSRCERFEARLAALEHFRDRLVAREAIQPAPVPLLPAADEDAPVTRRRTCSTCRGVGHLSRIGEGDRTWNEHCTACDGYGYMEVPA